MPSNPLALHRSVPHRLGWRLRYAGTAALTLASAHAIGSFAGEVPVSGTAAPLALVRSGERVIGSGVLRADGDQDIAQWLMRVHDASRRRNYVGTFVVWSSNGAMVSSRIWHACEGEQQVERVDSLSGTPRTTVRRNDQVMVFLPETRVVRSERRESLDLFPNLLQANAQAVPEFYSARSSGQERVAGFDADIVVLQPKDALRYGYRIWTEKRSQLIVKLQTLDAGGKVLEQSAFSELEIDAPVRADKLVHLMDNAVGYRVEKLEPHKVSAMQEGWSQKAPVPGFRSTGCVRRPGADDSGAATLQWTFSDGLATVSLFLEPYDRQRHAQEQELAISATQTLTRRIGEDWWLTAVGEVPSRTLRLFAASLVRRK